MNRQTFDDAMTEVFAVFGLNPKAEGILGVWFRKVEFIPDEAVGYIAEQLCEGESLPRNVPLAMKRLWFDWRAKNPQKVAREDCPHCRNTGVRQCWWDDVNTGRWVYFAVPCPVCQQGNPHCPESLHELEDRGVVIMPVDYSGGPVAFDRDHGYGCLHPVALDTSKPREKMHLGRLPDARAGQRTRALTDEERDDYAQAEAF